MSSLVSIFLSSFPMLPDFSWSKRIWPWNATIAPLTASTSSPSATRSIWVFCRPKRCWAWTSRLDCANSSLFMRRTLAPTSVSAGGPPGEEGGLRVLLGHRAVVHPQLEQVLVGGADVAAGAD